MAVCFPEGEVRTTGRTSMGVRGIRLRDGDYVVAAARAKPGKAVWAAYSLAEVRLM